MINKNLYKVKNQKILNKKEQINILIINNNFKIYNYHKINK